MFCFITSIRARSVSSDWRLVSELFERTAESVYNQSDENFRLIVVCHDKPMLSSAFDERLEFIEAKFPEPPNHTINSASAYQLWRQRSTALPAECDWCDETVGRPANYNFLVRDKVCKLFLAMERARELNASAVMPIDADDLVHRDLVSFVINAPPSDGWYIEKGWSYSYGNHFIQKEDRFNLICGTCNILYKSYFSFPDNRERESRSDKLWFSEGHTEFVRGFSEIGAKISPIPFRAAIYITDHPGSLSGLVRKTPELRQRLSGMKAEILNWSKRMPLNRHLRETFGLNPLRP
jgi:hypothetical protein